MPLFWCGGFPQDTHSYSSLLAHTLLLHFLTRLTASQSGRLVPGFVLGGLETRRLWISARQLWISDEMTSSRLEPVQCYPAGLQYPNQFLAEGDQRNEDNGGTLTARRKRIRRSLFPKVPMIHQGMSMTGESPPS